MEMGDPLGKKNIGLQLVHMKHALFMLETCFWPGVPKNTVAFSFVFVNYCPNIN
jgi:hypothetical protein